MEPLAGIRMRKLTDLLVAAITGLAFAQVDVNKADQEALEIVFLVMQRYLVEGVRLSGIKG